MRTLHTHELGAALSNLPDYPVSICVRTCDGGIEYHGVTKISVDEPGEPPVLTVTLDFHDRRLRGTVNWKQTQDSRYLEG